ncbi:hypothetical protein OF83DRAFT_1165120 [Amylostereum chailletii]|nr:hypothetical protein OF83DRAFT_1165120 [Amylostereum chailletii]
MSVQDINTILFEGQKSGTSGLRKRVKIFQQELTLLHHYTENFVRAIFDAITLQGATFVVGSDGHYYSPEAVHKILQTASANDVAKANGGPAPEEVTDQTFAETKTISYKIINLPTVDISKIADTTYGPLKVSVIDSVADYLQFLEELFDVSLVKSFLKAHTSDFKVLFDSLHGVTGPYARAILMDTMLSVQSCVPLPYLGGGHPGRNLTYAQSLVEVVERDDIAFGAASEGDGDHNMIYGKGAFVTPSDSIVIIADWADAIPYLKKGGVMDLGRSMPTCASIDQVAKKKGPDYFEVLTGWKFFGNLMDAGRLSICGEEFFGTGSDRIRGENGLWAIVAWLNIVAATNKGSSSFIRIRELLNQHYLTYGRSFCSHYYYEEVSSGDARRLVAHVDSLMAMSSFKGKAMCAQISSASKPGDQRLNTQSGFLPSQIDGSEIQRGYYTTMVQGTPS